MKRNGNYIPVIVAGIIIFLFVTGEITLRHLPFPELEAFQNRAYSTIVTDRNGTILRILPLEGGLRREYVPLEELRPEIVRIFIESEDKRFSFHRGVDGFAVLRGFFQNRRAGRTVSGASTISMQLAGLVRPRKQTVGGKVLEAWDALRLEAKLSKREILELWLNSLPFGRQAEGVGSGSRAYFNISAADLSIPEAALLAVVPRHPKKYSPVDNPEGAYEGALRNAGRLRTDISAQELRKAARAAEPGNFIYHAPHFLRQIGTELGGKQGGRVTTTLDLELQQHFHRLLSTYQQRYAQSRITSAAGMLIDNHTGEVLAYVGSLDFFSGRAGEQLDGVTVPRQPGSCLKPFLYAAALEDGWYPNTLLPDVPLNFGGGEVYVPSNFTNSFSGPVRLRVALGSSLNVPAVYLLDEIGLERFGELLRAAGFHVGAGALEKAGLGAALGNLDVSLLELTRGFALFPRRGVPLELSWTLPEVFEGPSPAGRAVSEYTADIICDILSDPAARARGFGYNSAFTLPFPAMFKTGTTDQFQHIWALAATPDYTVGIWMGNNTGETVIGRTGSSVPARIAAEVLTFARKGRAEFPVPAGAVPVEICTVSGQRGTELCPSVVTEYLPAAGGEGAVPGPCTFHILRNGTVTTEYPEKYHAWLRELGRSGGFSFSGGEGLEIIHPRGGAVFYYDPTVSAGVQALRVEAAAGRPGACTLYVNGERAGTVFHPPYVWFLPLQRGAWELTVSNTGSEATVRVEVR